MSPALAGRFSTTAPPGKPPRKTFKGLQNILMCLMLHTEHLADVREDDRPEEAGAPGCGGRVSGVQGPEHLQGQPLTEHENLGPAFDPTLPPPDHVSGLGSSLPCLVSLGQLLGRGLWSPSPPRFQNPGKRLTSPRGGLPHQGLPLQAQPPPSAGKSVYTERSAVHTAESESGSESPSFQ